MDPEERARQQNLRVIVSESVMVIATIMMVVILAFIVSGYWLNSDFKVERQGMLQISSVPSGATIEVDGDAPWFQRTNTSKILSSGEHTIILTKDNYDTWTKTIVINEGLLYKLNYPRLFLKNRTKEIVQNVSSLKFATISPNHKMLLLVNNTTDWSLMNLDSDDPKLTSLDIAALFPADTTTDTVTIFDGKIISANWDESNEHVLMQIDNNQFYEWILLNIKNPAKSINLTRQFAQPFDKISSFNHSSSILLALSGGVLYKIDLDAMQISPIIASDVDYYDFYDSEIIFVNNQQIGILKNFNTEVEYIKDIQPPVKALFGKFYDERYIFLVEGNVLTVYKKGIETPSLSATISFVPENVKIGPGAEFVFMNNGNSFATLDMESMKITEWSMTTNHFGWLDGHMLYEVEEGVLSVCDYDGLNRRTLASNVSEYFPATVTNDKWLYYFSDGNLVREWLVAK